MKKQTNQKKKSHKVLWIILAIVVVIAIAGVALIIRGLNNMTEQFAAAMGNTAEATVGTIEVTTQGIGVVEAADVKNQYTDYSVTLHRLYKENGERVTAGEVIAEYESVVLDDTIAAMENQLAQVDAQLSVISKNDSTTVSAPVAGRVKKIYAQSGDSVLTVQTQQGALAVISADGNLKVEFQPQEEVLPGQKVVIVYDETRIQGSILEVSGNEAVAIFKDSAEYDLEKEVTIENEDGVGLGSGITACGHEILVTADSGSIKSISVKENEKVLAGSSMFKLENVSYSQEYITLLEQRQQLAQQVLEAKEYKKGYVVVAQQDGIISDLTAAEGDKLAAGSVFCRLQDTSAYKVVLDIDELDIQGIEPGQQVEVTVDAIEDVTYNGEVLSVSMSGENVNGVGSYKVTVLLEDAQNLLPGMSANGKITMNGKTDALLAPIDTIQTIDGKKSVTVVNEDGTMETREVTLGLVNNQYAEILEGVSQGEKLQVIVKLEDIYSQMGITMEDTSME